MINKISGIAVAGNIIIDTVKNIDCYPQVGMLANIRSMSRAVGGAVPNVAINLAKIDANVPVSAIGRVGNDENGMYAVSQLSKYGIDTAQIKISPKAPTSFCDVMNMSSGERTFFHARGANAEFSPADIRVAGLHCNMLHIGYILLLDAFDREDSEYGTVMSRFLKKVRERGIKTSVDVVSDSTADYKKKIVPALRYCNYAIINEIESCNIWGISPRYDDGSLAVTNIRLAMERMAESGVSDKVIVHSKEAGFCLDVKSGAFSAVASLKIPKKEIKGSVGAGDSFCAAGLYGIYNGFSDTEILCFASAAAACNLFSENAVDGMRSKEEILRMSDKYGRLRIKEVSSVK